MTIDRVRAAAWRRGIYFDGEKRFRNTMIGCAYEIYTPSGSFYQSDTLTGLYRKIMQYPTI